MYKDMVFSALCDYFRHCEAISNFYFAGPPARIIITARTIYDACSLPYACAPYRLRLPYTDDLMVCKKIV